VCGAVALLDASAALASEPIVGRWSQFGGVIEYFATGPTTFEARVIEQNNLSCRDRDPAIRLSGSGAHYTGTIRYYFTGSCEFAGDGTLDITLGAGGDSGHLIAQGPGGGSRTEDTIRRVAIALQGSGSELPGIVYGRLLDLQLRYRALSRRHLRSRLRALGRAASAHKKVVSRFRSSDNHDRQLKACAVSGFAIVVKGSKVRTAKAGRGLTKLSHRCLKPDRKAGIVPSRDPGKGHYVASSGKVPRLEFDVVGANATNFVVVIATRCGGAGYAAASSRSLAIDNNGTFGFMRDLPAGGSFAGSRIEVQGTLKPAGVATGGARWTWDDPTDSPDGGVLCNSGPLPWGARL
jgi:hypothetical protein